MTFSKNTLTAFLVIIFFIFIITGCGGGGGGSILPSSETGSSATSALESVGGNLTVSVNWPKLTSNQEPQTKIENVQNNSEKIIPSNTEAINITVTGEKLERNLTGTLTQGRTSITFYKIPVGVVNIQAEALSKNGTLLAQIKKDVLVEEGNNGAADLNLGVLITSTGFSPDAIVVPAGSTLYWLNDDENTRRIISSTSFADIQGGTQTSFDSGDLQYGSSFSQTFNTVGRITYYDYTDSAKQGIIIVKNIPVIETITKKEKSLTPAIGDEVILTGKNFGSFPDLTSIDGLIIFNNVRATTISEWSDTQITCTIPQGATSGAVRIIVNGVSSSEKYLTIDYGEPIIDAYNPGNGNILITPVIITGTNFGTTKGKVGFGGVICSDSDISSWSDTEITATVPLGASSGKISVMNSKGLLGLSNGLFIVDNLPPFIDTTPGKTPKTGFIGDIITIYGNNFGNNPAKVVFKGISANISSWTDTQIDCTIPNGAMTGQMDVISGETGLSGSIDFIIRDRTPVIDGVFPTSAEPGQAVTITGNYLGSNRGQIFFNSVMADIANITLWSDNRIICIVPQGATSGRVTVKTLTGLSSNSAPFEISGSSGTSPLITSLGPDVSHVNGYIMINGRNFGSRSNASKVLICGIEAVTDVWSDTYIKCRVPVGAVTNPQAVKVITTTAESNFAGLTILQINNPAILKQTPNILKGICRGLDNIFVSGKSNLQNNIWKTNTADSTRWEIQSAIPDNLGSGLSINNLFLYSTIQKNAPFYNLFKINILNNNITMLGNYAFDENSIIDLDVDSSGYIFVLNNKDYDVKVFDPDGNYISSFGSFSTPAGIAVENDYVFITDQNFKCIWRYEKTANASNTRPVRFGANYLSIPSGICTDPEGFVYVVDNMNGSLVKFFKNTMFQASIAGQTGNPYDITVGRDRIINVLSIISRNYTLLKYTQTAIN